MDQIVRTGWCAVVRPTPTLEQSPSVRSRCPFSSSDTALHSRDFTAPAPCTASASFYWLHPSNDSYGDAIWLTEL